MDLLFWCHVLLLLSLLHVTITISKKRVEESNTGALLAFPELIDGVLYNHTWEVAPAQFGYQKYGGKLTGQIILPMNESYHLECDGGEPKYNARGEIANPYIHYINEYFSETTDIQDFIMVIDRLDCYFVDKVEVAQNLGASGVIICDKKQENLFTMWMPSDWSDDIDIPSVLLQEKNCEILMEHLGVRNWNPYESDVIYPAPTSSNWTWTVAEIEWGLPHDDDRVEWELWTSSNDLLGTEFKHNFEQTSIALDAANDTVFTPHTYILNGSHWSCTDSSLPCRRQCTNNGRYCAVDPEYDLTRGLDGMDVIQENLRSLCVWEYDKIHFGETNDVIWWKYVVAWDENCGILRNNTEERFNEDCAYEQMDYYKPNQALSNFVRQCIIDSGGYDYNGSVNTILRKEVRLRENSSVYALPMVRVNEFMIHGNIDCSPPVTVQSCEVLAAICAGFINGTQPDQCFVTPAPTMCGDSDLDCNGTCYGSHLYDACNRCLLVSSPYWNECIGCNGIINATFDCEQTCQGTYGENPCGFCIDSTRNDFETYGQDCADSCLNTNSIDMCGECLPSSSTLRDSCIGCDGVADSGKSYNPCGECIHSDTKDFDTYGQDCAGNCSTGDTSITRYVDDCGNCLLVDDRRWNGCLANLTAAIDNSEVEEVKRTQTELTTVIVIVCIVAFLVILAACIIIAKLWKKQGEIQERFNSLASTYVSMDDEPKHSKATKKGMSSVPDEESGEDN